MVNKTGIRTYSWVKPRSGTVNVVNKVCFTGAGNGLFPTLWQAAQLAERRIARHRFSHWRSCSTYETKERRTVALISHYTLIILFE